MKRPILKEKPVDVEMPEPMPTDPGATDQLSHADRFKDWVTRIPTRACLLCGGYADIWGYFRPDYPQEYGAHAGKCRAFIYCLCTRCFEKPEKRDLVEKVIWHEYNGTYAPTPRQ